MRRVLTAARRRNATRRTGMRELLCTIKVRQCSGSALWMEKSTSSGLLPSHMHGNTLNMEGDGLRRAE